MRSLTSRKALILLLILSFCLYHMASLRIPMANATPLSFKVMLREHQSYAAYYPIYAFSKPSGSLLKMDSNLASMGAGYVFFTAPRAWLNGKYIRFAWDGTFSIANSFVARINDGSYSESSDVDFPSGAALLSKGSGILQTLASKTGTFAVETQDVLVNIAGTEAQCTVFFHFGDAWSGQSGYLDIDWIEINTGPGGSGNVFTQSMDDSITMGRTATYGDYGTLGTGTVFSAFVSFGYTTSGLIQRNGISITNNSVVNLAGDVHLEALPNSNCSFVRWLVNATVQTDNPYLMTILHNTTVWCYFGGGYYDGYTDGWVAGNASGYGQGWAAGNSTGWASGWISGNASGYGQGWTAGNASGYGQGWTAGNSTGWASGWASGNATGYAIGYAVGYADGLVAGGGGPGPIVYYTPWAVGALSIGIVFLIVLVARKRH